MAAMTGALDLSVWRNDDVYEQRLRVRGLDLTDVALAMQIRMGKDVSGPAEIVLGKVTNGNAQGLRVAGVSVEDGVPTSDLRIRLNKSARQALPYAGEMGDDTALVYALLIAGRTRLAGRITMLAHAYDCDDAPVNRPMAYSGPRSTAMPASAATLTMVGEEVVDVAIDGADIVAGIAAGASAARLGAEGARDAAQLAADSAQAASRYFATRAAGEAGSTVGQLFSTDDGAGSLVYYRRTSGGSTEIARALTPAALAAAGGAAKVGFQRQTSRTAASNLLLKAQREWHDTDFTSINAGLLSMYEGDGGGRLKVTPGEHVLGEPIVMQPGMLLQGYGAKATTLSFPGSDGVSLPFYTGVGDCRIMDLALTGPGAASGAHGVRQQGTANKADQLYDFAMQDVLLRDWGTAVRLRSVHKASLVRLRGLNCLGGIWLEGQCLDPEIVKPRFVLASPAEGGPNPAGSYAYRMTASMFGADRARPEGVAMWSPRGYGHERTFLFEALHTADLYALDSQATVVGLDYAEVGGFLNVYGGYINMAGTGVQSGTLAREQGAPLGAVANLHGLEVDGSGSGTSIAFQVGRSGLGNGCPTNFTGCVARGMTKYDYAVYSSRGTSLRGCRGLSNVGTSAYFEGLTAASGRPVIMDECEFVAAAYWADDRNSGALVPGFNRIAGFDRRGFGDVPMVASAATITLPALAPVVKVGGSTLVTAITPEAGRMATLVFTGAASVNDGGNLRLNGSFTGAPDAALTLASDGINWWEVGRSPN